MGFCWTNNGLKRKQACEHFLTNEEKTQKALGDILGYFDQLSELDTEGVEPLSHAAGIANVTREDIISNDDMRDAVLSNAPETKDGTILVPKTFD